jgi:putative ABC transport system permease protein
VYVPYTTVQKKLQRVTYINDITISAESSGVIKKVVDDVSQLLRVRHKIMPGDDDDFMARTLEEMAALRTQATQTMTYLLASIAGVSLLVGGIGIMNIMLVVVTERTREIGIRKALGATRRIILMQFLTEAIVLCVVGGLLGAAAGMGGAFVFHQSFGWATNVGLDAIVIAVAFSGAIGVMFGVWPAMRAARLDPIEALRFE